MQRLSRGALPRWVQTWVAVTCLGSGAPGAEPPAPPSPAPAKSNPWNIDYGHPETYTTGGTQTSFRPEDWELVRKDLEFARIDLLALSKLYAWKATWFQSSAGGGKFVGRHTIQDLLLQRSLTGCHDHGLIVAAVLRKWGVPAVLVDATGIQWALEYPEACQSFRGHVFVEAFLQNAWMLLDSVTGEYVCNYDPLNPLLPVPKPPDPKGFYVMFKGLDPADYGIGRIEQLNEAQAACARRIRDQVPGFRDPGYTLRRLSYRPRDRQVHP